MESTSTRLSPGAFDPYTVNMDVDIDLIERLSHTERFDVEEVVVTRRGTTIPVNLMTRSHITVASASLVYDQKTSVALVVEKQTGTVVELSIPANAPVSMYTLSVTGNFENKKLFNVSLKKKVVVLFNPWSKQDGVFMEDEKWRQEYVSNSSGRLYVGNLSGMPWNLALYRPDSLRAVIFLLENRSKLTLEEKRNPIIVAREMSALVNVQDDNGVLVGRWDGKYEGGRSPSFWRGSGQILQQFYRSQGEAVQYGQCWVFSGVLLTVLRILGIPSRSVTNFSSAHDTNRNRTIDQYYDENGDKVKYLTTGNDSIWNFHVWNEAYMSRPDLPSGFGGWQVVDSTPQEQSPQGGGYRTGPSPLKAILNGSSVAYDTNFVIAEVNSDIKKYTVGADGAPRLFQVDTESVGKNISTKSVGSWEREDITHLYKYAQGTEKERKALYEGYKELLAETQEVEFNIPQPAYKFGQNVNLKVEITSKVKQHHIRGKIMCAAVSYTGHVLKDNVVTQTVDVKVNKEKMDSTVVPVSGDIFSEFSGTKVFLRFNVYLAVQGTSQIFSKTVSVATSPPEIELSTPDKVQLGKETQVIVNFKNPIPYEMKDVSINIESDDLLKEDIIATIGTISANAKLSYSFHIVGMKLGTFDLIVGLNSNKTVMVTGEKKVEVIRSVDPNYKPVTPPVEVTKLLKVVDVDMKLANNQTKHRTNRYEYPNLVVRRGDSFSITATTADPLPSDAKIVTRAVFQLVTNKIRNPYSFEVLALSTPNGGNKLDIELKPPANAAIGEYELILTMDKNGIVTVVHDNTKYKVVILFNPWCFDDTCHYSNIFDLDEYVLNNKGRIWVGNSYSNYGRPWQFAQFKKDSLEVSLWLIGKMSNKDRSDPVKVTRHISAMVNVQDDKGLIVGNWSGKYDDGKSPSYWVGSAEILAKYNQTKEPVRYGQCWVFSGVETTVLRSLGLAARSVSNFNSAHDTNSNRAIDKFYNESGKAISSRDSIWNFHVWNEAYMSRPDLPAGFSGWQVLDSTPQEQSPQGGGHRVGPAPRRAVKLGQKVNYDVEFVISEVNADIRSYTVFKDGTQRLISLNSSHIGKNISTKAIGSNWREDITLDYKFQEGSTSERAALLAETDSEKKVGLELTIDDNILIGQGFFVKAKIINKSSTTREFKVTIHGCATLYTGAPGQSVKSIEVVITLDPKQSKMVEMQVEVKDYLRILEGGNFINFVAMALNSSDKLSVVKTADCRLKTPDIVLKLPEGGLKLYQPASIKVSFINPLDRSLTWGKFTLSGEGYIQDASVDITFVQPSAKVTATMEAIPVKSGSFSLVARFTSNQLTDILGDEDVKVV